MFLGMHRAWWIAAGLCFVAGLVLIGGASGGTLGKVAGFLLLLLSMGIFGMSPRRSRRDADTAAVENREPLAPPAMPAPPPRPRATIEARDASDV